MSSDGAKGRYNQASRQRGGSSPHFVCWLPWGGVFRSQTRHPFFLWQGREGLALSQTGCMRSYLTRGPTGIIPSGMIPQSTAINSAYTSQLFKKKGVQGKEGNHGGCLLALTTHIQTRSTRFETRIRPAIRQRFRSIRSFDPQSFGHV